GRMFAERDHVHTLLYNYEWAAARQPDGVGPELALDHRYPGLVMVVGELSEAATREELDQWYRTEHFPGVLPGSAIDQVLAFSPMPLLSDAPGDVPRTTDADRRFLHLYFVDTDPAEVWPAIARHGDELASSGLGRLVWASPFVPTVPGTDTYTDQLW